jgi:DNA-binding NarL/FixJ family response regulator
MTFGVEPRPRARVIIADDHGLTRAGLRALLADAPEFEVVGEAANGNEAVSLCGHLRPELVLMDLRMPDMDGLEATRAIKQISPETKVLILSMFEEPRLLAAAVDAGAMGFVLKSATEAALRTAISDALAGNFSVDPLLIHEALQLRAADSALSNAPPPPPDILSGRELQVLALLARGYTNREIAFELIITPSTVKVHVEHILSKMRVVDRTQAAVVAIELGYITPERPEVRSRAASQTCAESPGAC